MDTLRQYVSGVENCIVGRGVSSSSATSRPTLLTRRASLKESLRGACGLLPQSKSTPDMRTPLLKAFGLTNTNHHRHQQQQHQQQQQHPGEFITLYWL
ncbi:hypothetical protein Pmani_039069 [Petrolisthes manimaculis]|uniref:Uncharacterized protein n=1 Tax=Petrolisthes manimaculis TaxID=1843537 RepID=A0AAE1NEZ2_9EUCA|nr:hypothetical protein Pmani_039069 [Petrolisthes manimaculis]